MALGQGIIRRKVVAAKAELAEGGPGADRGWRLALARAARDCLKLDLDVVALGLDRRSLGELMELPQPRSLIGVLEGPGEGLGVIVLSPQVMTGFIEAQTTGRLKATEVPPRRPTRTDAAMVVAVIDAALSGLETALAEEADLFWAGGFRYASFLDDPRPLGLLLDDEAYKVLRAEVSLAEGMRGGEILLALPAEGRGLRPAGKLQTGVPDDPGPVFAQALAERVQGAQCRLDAVLARLTMSLADVIALTDGAVLPLPQSALDRISLEGSDGRRLAEGRLGQNRGMRAIRLNAEMSGDTLMVGGPVMPQPARRAGDATMMPLQATGTG
ncbi:MAG: FliM/FliN family flagellar motor switch protein [Paracoccaceae bacterium]